MLHPTYKHLEDRIRLAGLTLGQWAQLFACALAAWGLAQALPLPGSWSLSIAMTICGLPAAAAIAFMQADFDVRRWLLDAAGFPAARRRFHAGPPLAELDGYVLADAEASRSADRAAVDLERLWDAA